MGVLHEGKLVALDGKLRQAVHHREDAVMVTRRNEFEKPSPCCLGSRQDEGGLTWIGGDLSFDEIEDRRVASRRDRETRGPAKDRDSVPLVRRIGRGGHWPAWLASSPTRPTFW